MFICLSLFWWETCVYASPSSGGRHVYMPLPLLVGDMCICLSLFWWETCLYASPSSGGRHVVSYRPSVSNACKRSSFNILKGRISPALVCLFITMRKFVYHYGILIRLFWKELSPFLTWQISSKNFCLKILSH